MRVVRYVQHQRGLARNDLETPRQLDHGQPRAHGLGRDRKAAANGFERGQRTRCIDQLVGAAQRRIRSEEHTSELQSPCNLVCRLLLEKKKKQIVCYTMYYQKDLSKTQKILICSHDNYSYNLNTVYRCFILITHLQHDSSMIFNSPQYA